MSFLKETLTRHLKKVLITLQNFDLKDKHFMQKAVQKKARGNANLDDIGTVHLYNTRFKCFPIGLLDKITKIIYDFGEYYNKEIKIFLNDARDQHYLHYTTGKMSDRLNTKHQIRAYQLAAIDAFRQKHSGIINIATGGGKTFVAAEIIRLMDARTLWIIDRKELLDQTKDVLEELLGIELGVISSGIVDIKDITIATIQSLHSKLRELQSYLYTVNMVVVDEYHKSAAETYQKVFAKLPNTKYRLGLTATPSRDDGKDPILYSILGEVIYKVTTDDLIRQGYLVRPEVEFHELKTVDLFKCEYAEDYNNNIVENVERNNKIVEIINKNSDKKL
jgi:superfamily II DNA or RNA helicase